MKKEKRNRWKIIKLILTIFLIVAIAILIWEYFPLMKNLGTKEGQIEFKEEIERLGVQGIVLLFALQVLQILLVVLPGEPFEVLAGMCYGAIGGAVFITLSVFLTTAIVFYMVRRYGKRYLYTFFSKEKIKKIENNRVLKEPRKLEIVLCILFIIPASPKDLIVYVGGLLPIKPIRFILISTFVRFPSVITSTMVGANVLEGNWITSLMIYMISFTITVIILWIISKKDKNKEIEEILKQ